MTAPSLTSGPPSRLHNRARGHQQVLAETNFISASGSTLTDAQGRTYVDLYGNGTLPLGHDQSLAERTFVESLPLNIGKYSSPERAALLEELGELYPGYGAYQLYSSGTAGNEGMLRYAMAITGRSSFAGFRGAFHGHTKAMVSVTDMDPYHGFRIGGFGTLPYPGYDPKSGGYDGTRVADARPARIIELIDKLGSDKLAGVLIEPIAGKALIRPPEGWLLELHALLRTRGILLLADEYLTGGRTGNWLECRAQGVEPDVFNVGKCLKTGVPFAAIACRDEHVAAVSMVKGEDTAGGQPALCRNARLTIERLRQGDYVKDSFCLAEIFSDCFTPSVGRSGIRRVFARGGLLGLELRDRKLAVSAARLAHDRGVLVAVIKRCIRLTPALNIDPALFRTGLNRLQAAICEADARGK